MKTYREKKEEVRNEAKQWQSEFADKVYSWQNLADATAYFEKAGKRYGLLREFRENGIL